MKVGMGWLWEGVLGHFWNWLCSARPVPSLWGLGDRTFPSGGPRTEAREMFHPPRPSPTATVFKM